MASGQADRGGADAVLWGELVAVICPCCGHRMTGEARDELSPQQSEILALIARIPGRKVRVGEIIEHLYQLTDEPDTAAKIVNVQVFNINKKLGRRVIEGFRGRGNGGYRLAV